MTTGRSERKIPIDTPAGRFEVWTARVGASETIKLLLLHGGPGFTSEVYDVFDQHLPAAGIEHHHYDQLGSFRSDQPDDDDLWTIDRFVDEVEQVRQALGLGPDDCYVVGQSWGGILAIEYALAHQENIKGLVISNMMSSCPAYARYAEEVLGPQLPPEVLAEVRALEAKQEFDNPRYEELLMTHFYPKHALRRPLDRWPASVLSALEHLNKHVYTLMQGPSEFGVRGRLETWDRSADLGAIEVPTLVIGAAHDTMDPEHMRWMASQVRRGRHLHCPDGSHLAMWDDEAVYHEGLIRFLHDVDQGRF